MFNPRDWYWAREDGAIYGSARGALLTADDTAYSEWLASGGIATRWPVDVAGAQTDAALQEVLTTYGLHLTRGDALLSYAAQRRWELETGGIEVAGATIRTDRESQGLINGAYTMAQEQPEQVFRFKAAAGWISLTAAEITAIARQVGAHVQACFGAEANVAAMITAEPPTITTREEVDDAFAAALGA